MTGDDKKSAQRLARAKAAARRDISAQQGQRKSLLASLEIEKTNLAQLATRRAAILESLGLDPGF